MLVFNSAKPAIIPKWYNFCDANTYHKCLHTYNAVIRNQDTNIHQVYKNMNNQVFLCAWKHHILNMTKARLMTGYSSPCKRSPSLVSPKPQIQISFYLIGWSNLVHNYLPIVTKKALQTDKRKELLHKPLSPWWYLMPYFTGTKGIRCLE